MYSKFLKKNRIFNILFHVLVIFFSLSIAFSSKYNYSLLSRISWQESLHSRSLFLGKIPSKSIIITDSYFSRFLYWEKVISILLFRNIFNKKLVLEWLQNNAYPNSKTNIYIVLSKESRELTFEIITDLWFEQVTGSNQADVFIYWE